MKKRFIVLSIVSCAAIIVGSMVAISMNKNNSFERMKANDEKTITWTKDTGATALTALGNEVTLGDRYTNDWVFGGDYFAVCEDGANLIDNFTQKDQPFRSLKAFTVVYESSSNPLYVKFLPENSYSGSTGAWVENVASGTKYEIGVTAGWDYSYCTASDIFPYFYLCSDDAAYTRITSLTIEYVCS